LLEASRGLGPIQRKFGPPELVKKELPTLGLDKIFEDFSLEIFVRGCEGGREKITRSADKG